MGPATDDGRDCSVIGSTVVSPKFGDGDGVSGENGDVSGASCGDVSSSEVLPLAVMRAALPFQWYLDTVLLVLLAGADVAGTDVAGTDVAGTDVAEGDTTDVAEFLGQ